MGTMCTEEWTDRPLSVCEIGLTDTKSPERQGQDRAQRAVTPQAGSAYRVPAQLCAPSHHPSPARPPVCHGGPMSPYHLAKSP